MHQITEEVLEKFVATLVFGFKAWDNENKDGSHDVSGSFIHNNKRRSVFLKGGDKNPAYQDVLQHCSRGAKVTVVMVKDTSKSDYEHKFYLDWPTDGTLPWIVQEQVTNKMTKSSNGKPKPKPTPRAPKPDQLNLHTYMGYKKDVESILDIYKMVRKEENPISQEAAAILASTVFNGSQRNKEVW